MFTKLGPHSHFIWKRKFFPSDKPFVHTYPMKRAIEKQLFKCFLILESFEIATIVWTDGKRRFWKMMTRQYLHG